MGNEFLNAGMFPRMPLPSELPKPLDDGATPGLLPSHNSQPELSEVSRRQSLMPTRTASTGPGLSSPTPNRQSTIGLPGPRKSVIGTASSHGRLFKVLGDLFLLSGRTEDASIWCVLECAFKRHRLKLTTPGIQKPSCYSKPIRITLGMPPLWKVWSP